MSAEIRTLPVEHRIGFPPDPGVVKYCEDLLELAKSGKMRAISSAVVYHDESIPDGETGSGWALTLGTRYALNHALAQLCYRFQRFCDER